MTALILSLIAFLALHSIPALPRLRDGATQILGLRVYLGLYSLISILVLGWVFHAALNSDYIALWDPSAWQAQATLVLAPLGLFLILAGLLSANPTSISLRHSAKPGAIVAITRHPVLWGFMFWAFGHLLANGDLRSLILFAGLGLFALAGIPIFEKRAARKLGEDWRAIASATSIMPFGAILGGRNRLRLDTPLMLATVMTGAITAWLLLGGHVLLFGADPLLLATGN